MAMTREYYSHLSNIASGLNTDLITLDAHWILFIVVVRFNFLSSKKKKTKTRKRTRKRKGVAENESDC